MHEVHSNAGRKRWCVTLRREMRYVHVGRSRRIRCVTSCNVSAVGGFCARPLRLRGHALWAGSERGRIGPGGPLNLRQPVCPDGPPTAWLAIARSLSLRGTCARFSRTRAGSRRALRKGRTLRTRMPHRRNPARYVTYDFGCSGFSRCSL